MGTDTGKKKRVIIIDNDTINSRLVRKQFEKTNIVDQILEFTSGQDALEFLRRDTIGEDSLVIIVVAVDMHVMDGVEFLTEFRALDTSKSYEHVEYLMHTGTPRGNAATWMTENKVDCLIRPLTVDHAISMIGKETQN